MSNIALYFGNNIDQMPFVLARQNGMVKIYRDLRKFNLLPGTITIGFIDTIDSLRTLNAKIQFNQSRIETVYALNICYSKGDMAKKWSFQKQEIIGCNLSKDLVISIKNFDLGVIDWGEFSASLFEFKKELIMAVEKTYKELVDSYIDGSEIRKQWLEKEHEIDSYFLRNQFYGIEVDRKKIENLINELNLQKYSSLLYLEKNHGIDISSSYLSDDYINKLILAEVIESEKTEELSELIQVIDDSDKRIEAIRKIRECKIDFSNLIKHYSFQESQLVFPQYQTIGSSSGRIFITSPGTQYLKKSRRDIFAERNGFRLCYFDFRNYEPGIAAGLSGDPVFIQYYNSGDMYQKISIEQYKTSSFRKEVKVAVLSTLYGMSRESLVKHFSKTKEFDPIKVVDVLDSFKLFQKWKKTIIETSTEKKETKHEIYTRKFTPDRKWKINTSAVNHMIQSTGSKILKRCIIEVAKIPGVRILIPMHDAILCELSAHNYSENEVKVIMSMEKIFCEEIGDPVSKVIVGRFHE